jgi:hypothetical protein
MQNRTVKKTFWEKEKERIMKGICWFKRLIR